MPGGGRSGGSTHWALGLQACIIFIINCPVSLQGQVSTEWSVVGQGVFSHCNWFWRCPPGLAAFLGLELKHNGGLDVVSREERAGEQRTRWG